MNNELRDYLINSFDPIDEQDFNFYGLYWGGGHPEAEPIEVVRSYAAAMQRAIEICEARFGGKFAYNTFQVFPQGQRGGGFVTMKVFKV